MLPRIIDSIKITVPTDIRCVRDCHQAVLFHEGIVDLLLVDLRCLGDLSHHQVVIGVGVVRVGADVGISIGVNVSISVDVGVNIGISAGVGVGVDIGVGVGQCWC